MKKIILIATKNKPEYAGMVAEKIQSAADAENFSFEVSAISIVDLNLLQKLRFHGRQKNFGAGKKNSGRLKNFGG